MQNRARSTSPRKLLAGYWLASMAISGAGGTFLLGFDLGTTLTWLTLTILGPLLVWAFAMGIELQSRTQARPGPAEEAQPRRSAASPRPTERRASRAVRTPTKETAAIQSG